MTVKDLIDRLAGCDPAALVVLAQDAEDIGYSPLGDLEAGFYASAGIPGQGAFYAVGDIWTEADGAPAVCLDPVH